MIRLFCVRARVCTYKQTRLQQRLGVRRCLASWSCCCCVPPAACCCLRSGCATYARRHLLTSGLAARARVRRAGARDVSTFRVCSIELPGLDLLQAASTGAPTRLSAFARPSCAQSILVTRYRFIRLRVHIHMHVLMGVALCLLLNVSLALHGPIVRACADYKHDDSVRNRVHVRAAGDFPPICICYLHAATCSKGSTVCACTQPRRGKGLLDLPTGFPPHAMKPLHVMRFHFGTWHRTPPPLFVVTVRCVSYAAIARVSDSDASMRICSSAQAPTHAHGASYSSARMRSSRSYASTHICSSARRGCHWSTRRARCTSATSTGGSRGRAG